MNAYQLLPFAVFMVVIVLWVIALVDLFRRPDSEFPPLAQGVNPRLFWGFFVIFFSGLGALAYYLMVMRPNPRAPR